MSLSWYVAQTHHASESLASRELCQQGFSNFVPLCRTARSSRYGLKRERLEPYIPGYLFVEFDTEFDHWRPICSTRGVKGLLSTSPEEPTRVRRGIVEELRSRCDKDGVVTVCDADIALQRFIVGADVRITSGPFTGRVGEVVWSNVDRVRVLLSLFGRETRTLLPCSEVELAA